MELGMVSLKYRNYGFVSNLRKHNILWLEPETGFTDILHNNQISARLRYMEIIQGYYTDFTEDLDSRLQSHNRGDNPHTSKYKPWRIKTAIAFSDRQKAIDFEEYLKTPSGRAFSKKRL